MGLPTRGLTAHEIPIGEDRHENTCRQSSEFPAQINFTTGTRSSQRDIDQASGDREVGRTGSRKSCSTDFTDDTDFTDRYSFIKRTSPPRRLLIRPQVWST